MDRFGSRLILSSETQPYIRNKVAEIEKYAESILLQQKFFFEHKQFCDVILLDVNNTPIPVHRIVLAGVSEYFRELFLDTKEQSNTRTVQIDSVDPDILNILINYVYSGEARLTGGNVERVMLAAKQFKFNGLIATCSKFITQNMDVDNAINVWLFSEQNSLLGLENMARVFICENFEACFLKKDFKSITETQFMTLLKNNNLTVKSEKNVVWSIDIWINHDPTNRDKLAPELLKFVNFPLLDPTFVFGRTEAFPSNCTAILAHWICWFSNVKCRSDFPQTFIRGRKMRDTLIVINGFEVEQDLMVHSYNLFNNSWTCARWLHPKGELSGFGALVRQSKLYIAGGFVGQTLSSRLLCYDVVNLKWSELAKMNCARGNFPFLELDGFFYAVGGKNQQNSSLNSVERYDIQNNVWSQVTILPEVHIAVEAAIVNDLIYVSGNTMGHILCYDPKLDEWLPHRNLPRLSNYSGFGSCQKHLYLVGGFIDGKQVKTIYKHPAVRNTWDIAGNLSKPRSNIKALEVGSRLYACGGSHGEKRSSTLEEHCTDTGKCVTLANIPVYSSSSVILVYR